MRDVARQVVGVLATILVLAGCSDDGDDATATTVVAAEPEFTGISDVVGAEGSTLTVLSDPLPVEGAGGPCSVTLDPWVEETATEVWVYVGYESEAVPPFEACEVAPREVSLELGAPVGERRVADALSATFRFVDGEWVGCGHVVMTCVPGPPDCDNVQDSVANLDVPQGSSVQVHGCDGTYAVADVDMAARDCPAGGDCRRVDRMFLVVGGEQWDVLYRDRTPGCGDVAAVEPDFPLAMCEGLPVP